jgi:hypothetical protein
VNRGATAFHASPAARVIHQHMPHHLRGHREEMRPIPLTHVAMGHQPDKRLLHERGRLHGAILPLAPEMPLGYSMQLRANQG